MSISQKIKIFLNYKFTKLKINRNEFIQNSGVSAAHISQLLNARQNNPSITNILKIANYFDTSIDKIIGRQIIIDTTNFKEISCTDINNNLKLFLINKLISENINAYTLERNCKIGRSTIFNFINDNNFNRSLSITTIVSIADYFNCSIDEMIGRV